MDGIILPKSDIWACGVTLIVMLTGRIPSYHKLHTGTFELDVDLSSLLSGPAKDLISKMVNPDPAKRPNAREALNHEWFTRQRR